jgi:hypothetical protein
MRFICQTCRKEYEKPAPSARTGFKGRSDFKCPQGHLMFVAFGFWPGFLVAFVLIGALYVGGAGVAATTFGVGIESRTAITQFGLGWIGIGLFLVLIGLGLGIRRTRQGAPLNKAANGWYGGAVGSLVGLLLFATVAWNRYISPVTAADMIVEKEKYVLKHFSVEGTVVYTDMTPNGVGFYRLAGPGQATTDFLLHPEQTVLVQVENRASLPRIRQTVRTFGALGLSPAGLTFVEYWRLKQQ